MRPVARLLALAALALAGCAEGEFGRTSVSPTPPKPVAQVDAVELWASPPAAINWDDKPGPDGVQVRLYLFQVGRPQPVMVDGAIEFRMYAGRVSHGGVPEVDPFKVWRFTSDDLDVRRFRSMVGWGYAARLGWGGQVPEASVVSVQAVYEPSEGQGVVSAPVAIALPPRVAAGPKRSVLGGTASASLERRPALEPLRFRHETIDADPPGAQNTLTLLADLDRNGAVDILVGCKRGPHNLYWYANPSWKRHAVAKAPNLEAAADLLDVNRDGRLDLVAGQDLDTHELCWFEQPADPAQPWPRHLIAAGLDGRFDLTVADVDADGSPEIVVRVPATGRMVAYDLPADVTVEPWPDVCCAELASDPESGSGLAVVDIDRDGQSEIIAGTIVYRRSPKDGRWEGKPYAAGYAVTRLTVADLDGDNRFEIVAAEGDSLRGRLVWFKPPAWTPHPLRDDLFHPQSLAVADVDGDGTPDIFVAEMGLGQNASPRMFVYRNLGAGQFQEDLVSRGVPTFEAKVGDMNGDGRLDIVGKPYGPERHVDVWFNVVE